MGPRPGIIGRVGHRVVPVVRPPTVMESTKAVLLLMLTGFLQYCDAASEPLEPQPVNRAVGPFVLIHEYYAFHCGNSTVKRTKSSAVAEGPRDAFFSLVITNVTFKLIQGH